MREAERLIGQGRTIPEAAKELGISEQTYHRWRNQYGNQYLETLKSDIQQDSSALPQVDVNNVENQMKDVENACNSTP